MSDPTKYERIFSALVTPTRADESVDFRALADVVEAQLARGVEGFYLCGSSAEALLLELDERREIVARVVEHVAHRVPIIAHVGTISTAQSIALAEHAENVGVDAISMIPPYYYAFSPQEIQSYYLDIIGAVGLPVLLYNIPQFTRVAFSKANAGELLGHRQVMGMKHTDQDLFALERMVDAFPDRVFFNGFDEQYLASLAAGARATIGTTVNLQPELFLRVRDRYSRGDIAGARRTQSQINYVVEVLVAHGVFPSAKYLTVHGGEVTGNCRAPFRPLDVEDRARLDKLAIEIQTFIDTDQ